MKKRFFKDLQIIYDQIEKNEAHLNSYYNLLKDEHPEAKKVISSFLDELKLPQNSETMMAAITRIVSLREDALEQVLQKEGLNEEEIIDKKEIAYLFVSNFHLKRHFEFIKYIEEKRLLTPFYRAVLKGVHEVGKAVSGWQSSWTSHIIHGINRELFRLFNGDEEKIYEMLFEKELFDLGHNGEVGDRCYSVLHKNEKGEYESIPYSQAFEEEVKETLRALDDFIASLEKEEDEVFGKKREWIEYLKAIKRAFRHDKRHELISYWADVDRKWMDIDTPLQIGHPLEYYEDHYKKAVALEWDLRVINPKLQRKIEVREDIKTFAKRWFDKFSKYNREILDKNIKQIDSTQLYIGRPMLYYGAEFNGLFSAQVVPNDEEVSSKLGKKIFAYADFVREAKIAKPMMRLSVEIFGEEFVKKQKEIVKNKAELWYKIYEISTIGHEFGHILWIDSDSESRMNLTGQFKNIEEFKATTGAIMAFFHNEQEELKEYILDDLCARSVSLIGWREVGEVLPYYCEGLIHLDLLFSSGVISFDKKIEIDYSKYEILKELYEKAYENLTKIYLQKKDASLFLKEFALKEKESYLPVKKEIREFVEFYYQRYKEIGQQIV